MIDQYNSRLEQLIDSYIFWNNLISLYFNQLNRKYKFMPFV